MPATAEEITAGDQVPVITGLLFDAPGNRGTCPPSQIGVIWVNNGLIGIFTTTLVVVEPLHAGVT